MNLEVGRIMKAHGIRGEVVVEALTNRADRFGPGAVLLGSDGRALTVVRSSIHGGPGSRAVRWIVAFADVGDRNAAEALRGTILLAEAIPPDGDELWVHDLVGATVTDTGGRHLGCVVAVEANPASDLLVLEEGGLIPLVFVVETGPGSVVVDPPAGLLD